MFCMCMPVQCTCCSILSSHLLKGRCFGKGKIVSGKRRPPQSGRARKNAQSRLNWDLKILYITDSAYKLYLLLKISLKRVVHMKHWNVIVNSKKMSPIQESQIYRLIKGSPYHGQHVWASGSWQGIRNCIRKVKISFLQNCQKKRQQVNGLPRVGPCNQTLPHIL